MEENAVESPAPEAAPDIGSDRGVSGPVQVLLAALSAGAGVIHLAMAPVHASASGVEAAGFALVGWFQLALAAVLLLRPARSLLTVAAASNLVVLAVWAVSRTAGLPVGAHPGEAESVGAADLTAAALEAGIVVLAVLALARPRLLAAVPRELRLLGAALPVAALLAVTLVVVSPSTAQHGHGGDDGSATTATAAAGGATLTLASVERDRCDKGFNPKAYWSEAPKAGADTVSIPGLAAEAPAAAMSGDGHAHGAGATPAAVTTPTAAPLVDPLQGRGSPALDKIVPKLSSDSEADAAAVVIALADLSEPEYEAFLYQLRKTSGGHSAHASTGDDTGGHGGHMGPTPWVAMTDPAQCARLAEELRLARDTALKYPTAESVTAAGWRKVTTYVPGIAAHYMNFSLVDSKFEIDKPEMILYDGNGPDAKVVGLSYYVVQPGEAEPTQGFTGDNDHYHRHIGLCVKGGIVVGDSQTTEADCAAQGGSKNNGAGGWMSHAWVVPGCESPWGLFSGATPVLDRQLAEQSGKDGGACAGSKARDRYDLTPGGHSPLAAPPGETAENASGPR